MPPSEKPRALFPDTSWGLILRCQERDEAFRVHLDQLFRRYWGPVYAYVRRNWANDDETAKDLTQAFFLSLIEREAIDDVAEARGRFRHFILRALKNFLCSTKRHANAKKRRPAQGLVSLDAIAAGESPRVAQVLGSDGDAAFDEDWRRAILAVVLDGLRRRAGEVGKQVLVDLFVASDLAPPGEKRPSYEDLAGRFGLTHSQVRNGLYWVRQEFESQLRREIQDQVASEDDLRLEIQDLFGR